jgi:hypothetical protein
MEEKENMKKRRINLFVLMVTSFISVIVMFFIDGYMHIFFVEFTSLEIFLTVLGRLVQYFAVLSLIYYFLYWPFRRNFE